MRFHPPLCLSFLSVLLTFTMVTISAIAKPGSPRARALAPLLRPLPLTTKAEPHGLAQVSPQIIRILNEMEASGTSNGPAPRALLETAFELEDVVGPTQRTAIIGSLMQMWQTARGLGLFTSEHKFVSVVSRGDERGTNAEFEYIVPLSKAPEFSRDLSNIRLVTAATRRVSDASLTPRDLAYLTQLQSIQQEIKGMAVLKKQDEGPLVNSLGQTKEEEQRLFKEAMEKAGDLALQKPNIVLKAKLQEGPAKANGYRWGLQVEAYNLSHYPTEIRVEHHILGLTEVKRIQFMMSEGSITLQLRPSQTEKITLWTDPISKYDGPADDLDGIPAKDTNRRKKAEPQYRGALLQVFHGKDDVVATWASDPTLGKFLDEEAEGISLGSLPRLGQTVKK